MSQDSNGNWIYYSTHVNGYVERYSMRGMRKRNASLLKKLNRAGRDPSSRKNIENLIVENNLPLARSIAERQGLARGWTKEKIDDAFQQCCLTLQQSVTACDDKLLSNASNFQMNLFFRMTSCINAEYVNRRTLENDTNVEFIPFDEENFADEETEEGINPDTLMDIVSYCCPKRTRDIIEDIFLHDMTYNEASFRYDLTSNRLRQIVEKGIKTVRLYCRQRNINPEDFYL